MLSLAKETIWVLFDVDKLTQFHTTLFSELNFRTDKTNQKEGYSQSDDMMDDDTSPQKINLQGVIGLLLED